MNLLEAVKQNTDNKKPLWILGIANSESSGVVVRAFSGDLKEAMEYMVSTIKEDRDNDEEYWECGSVKTKDLELYPSNGNAVKIDGYSDYSNYHIDYTMYRVDTITVDSEE